jgi:ATP-dependent DNA helicase RecG
MRSEHYSRNRRIMRALKILNLVEEYGEGVDRMFSEMEARLMEPPHFSATSSSVTVTLHNRSALSIEDQAWLALLGHLDLTVQERRALVISRHEESVTPRRLCKAFGESVDVDSLLGGATAKGLLVRVGRGGGARYVPSDEVVIRAGGAGVEARSRKRQMLLDEIRRRGSLSTAEAAEYLGEQDRALVRQMLDDLVRDRQAIAEGRTRARPYHVPGTRYRRAGQ